MTEATTLHLRLKAATLEDMARSLIVFSTMVPDGGTLSLPMTGAQARHLGRALELMAGIHASNAAARAYVDARADQAAASEGSARAMLDAALRQNRAALRWLCLAAAVTLLNLVVVVTG